ncbi:mannose-1-phosphate guanylyltransferase/mannose-6-phosphate isomerase [Piscirickettsia litoralis]|uniref:mannose-1-phosphate guanylyltransferase n=1 Tax=Piscirickettsia litoralis TaxID=1891921 RepID=A0ABX3A5K2_9GAMM|nr:mannose-1-phosphate guanylyltransferase/mannose-6-phosphate isomerase [Piscirickettsia litoralis]ODN42966.1 mannose-1-phosphate guanylyltransferase/mannose-6-phosphate isomerase [Piscirickettsia litoralis]
MIYPVILSGGSGSRLWPLSRALYPKQLLPVATEHTMLQDTVNRLTEKTLFASPTIICNHEHRFIVAEQLREQGISGSKVILEPCGRNTAPAAVIAALTVLESDVAADVLLLPSDHLIEKQDRFLQAIQDAQKAAANDQLVTFGIKPTHPESGYGYIQAGETLNHLNNGFKVSRFVEKPDLKTAENYLSSGDYSWNSGMFLFKAKTLIDIAKTLIPDTLHQCELALKKGNQDLDFYRLDEAEFSKCEDVSIDYAIMEKATNTVVIPVDLGWSDVGSWSALWEVSDKDAQGNHLQGDIINQGSKNCYLRSDGPLIASVGIDNLIVVATEDAVLVADKNDTQNVKKIVERLKQDKRYEHRHHTKIYRPWGWVQSLDNGTGFEIKRLSIKPGQTLSKQRHMHRSEHWIVLAGTAKISKGSETILLEPNQSAYIPIGEIHQLENPGKIDLEIIEVRSGSYLGEDDIERF